LQGILVKPTQLELALEEKERMGRHPLNIDKILFFSCLWRKRKTLNKGEIVDNQRPPEVVGEQS